MQNASEKGPERILTKDEVMAGISCFEKDAIFVRELSDEQGIYLLEAKAKDRQGDKVEYIYQRKGTFPNQNISPLTEIHVVYYEGETAMGGHNVAVYNSETGEWEDIK